MEVHHLCYAHAMEYHPCPPIANTILVAISFSLARLEITIEFYVFNYTFTTPPIDETCLI
jgi:hypothetical protein